MLRYAVMGKRREMGLGGVRDVSLKEAREYAEQYRRMARDGTDPIRERRQRKAAMLRPENNLKDIATVGLAPIYRLGCGWRSNLGSSLCDAWIHFCGTIA